MTEQDTLNGSETLPQESGPTYEEAVKQLEAIVARLETGDLSLDESLTLFEQGTGLAKTCLDQLNAVERQITQLIERADGVVEEAFETDT